MCLFKYFTSFLSTPPPHPLPHFESISFTIFSSPGPLSRSILFSLFWGWRYYVIVRGIEHKSRGSSGPMNYWWESQRDPPRSAHFTSSSPHSRVNQAKWREGGRGREGERKRGGGGVHCLAGGQSPPVTATELWMTGKWWENWCGINEPLFTWFIQSNVHVMIQQWSLFSPFTYHKFNMYSYCISFALWSCFLWSFSH